MTISASDARLAAGKTLEQLTAATGKDLTFFSGQFDVPESEDHGDAWVFNWNSAKYLQSWDPRDQVLAGPIAVPKDGGQPFLLGTSGTTEEELDRWRAQMAQGPVGATE